LPVFWLDDKYFLQQCIGNNWNLRDPAYHDDE